MRRLLLVTSVLCAIDTTQAFAQHEVSQQLLELEEADRNTFFTMQLRGSNKRCDQVIRTLFNAGYLDVDEWEALCRDTIRTRLMSLRPGGDDHIVALP